MQEKPSDNERGTIDLLVRYWPVTLSIAIALAGILSVWNELHYVRQIVSPKTVVEHKANEVEIETKRKIRWCLEKLRYKKESKWYEILSCAD